MQRGWKMETGSDDDEPGSPVGFEVDPTAEARTHAQEAAAAAALD